MSFDDILPAVGGFGKHQWKLYFLQAFPTIISAFYQVGNVILLAVPDFRCLLPHENKFAPYNRDSTGLNQWYSYDENTLAHSECTFLSNQTNTKCDNFVYNERQYGHTAVMEFGLVCNREYLIAVINSATMFGSMIGGFMFGVASDRWGRKRTLMYCIVLFMILGISIIYSVNIWMFLVIKLFLGTVASGIYNVYYILVLESTEPTKRVFMGSAVILFFPVATLTVSLLGYLCPTWKHLQLAYTVFGLPLFLYHWLVPESSRWLVSKNKTLQAQKGLEWIAKDNNVTVLTEDLYTLLAKSHTDDNQNTVSIFSVMKYPNLRKRVAILTHIFLIIFMAFYGVTLNIGKLNGNLYINVAIMGIVEIPGIVLVLYIGQKFGRRTVVSSYIWMAGLCLLLSSLRFTDSLWRLLWTLLGQLFLAACINLCFLYGSELLPTTLRNSGIGLISCFGCIGSMMSFHIFYLDKFWKPLPTLIFGILLFLAGSLCRLLPETYKKKLPETLEEGEKFGTDKFEQTQK